MPSPLPAPPKPAPNLVFGVWKRDLDRVLGSKERELGGWLIVGGLYSPPRIPREVRAESEDSLSSLRTVLGQNSDFFWLEHQPNLKVLVLILSEDC